MNTTFTPPPSGVDGNRPRTAPALPRNGPITPPSIDAAYRAGFERGIERLRAIDGGLAQIAPDQAARDALRSAHEFLAGERERVEREKYDFSPELRAEVDAKNHAIEKENAEVREEIAEIEADIERVKKDPDMSPEEKAAEIAELEADIREEESHLKQPVDLEKATAEIDSIMSDPGLSDEDREKRIDAIKERHGLSRGEMKDFFTQRLAGIHERSKERIDAQRKAHTEALDFAAERATQSHGAASHEALTARMALASVDAAYADESERNDAIASHLDSMYPSVWKSIASAAKSVVNSIGEAVETVMPVVKLIPGVGQIAGAIWGGVKAVGALAKGDVAGAGAAIVDAIPGVGGFVGKAIDAGKKLLGPVGTAIGKAVEFGKRAVDFGERISDLPRKAFEAGKQWLGDTASSVFDRFVRPPLREARRFVARNWPF